MGSAHLPEESKLIPGYRLDRYELLCPIAEGGMASVWIARQSGKHGFEKLVALKSILPKFASDSRFQEMFLDEARIAMRIEHPNTAQILDLGEENDVLYLVMEWVDGDALSKVNRICGKKGHKIPTSIILRIMADTCAGLHEAHELKDQTGNNLGVVHRDISPHNILVSTKGIAKLIDFGIAKARDRAGGETNAGVLKGKINYMAPEQALGKPVDRRADLWAIGASMYHLLTGRAPFEGENQLATLHLLTSGRPPPPMKAVAAPVAAIVRRALTHSPDKRFATAAEMRAALEDAMAEGQLRATTDEVAEFVNEQLADRLDKRKAAIDAALAAAAERKRLGTLFEPLADTNSGMISRERVSRPDLAPVSLQGVDLAGGGPVSSATLGSAALAGPAPPAPATLAAPRTSKRTIAILSAALGVAVLVAVVALLRPRSHEIAASPPATPAAQAPTGQAATTGQATMQASPAAPSATEASTMAPPSTAAPAIAVPPPASSPAAQPAGKRRPLGQPAPSPGDPKTAAPPAQPPPAPPPPPAQGPKIKDEDGF